MLRPPSNMQEHPTLRLLNSRSCPSCLRGRGIPNSVTVKGDTKTVLYRCERCHHRWSERQEPVGTLFSRPSD